MTILHLVGGIIVKGQVTSIEGRLITFYVDKEKKCYSYPHHRIASIEWEKGEYSFDTEE